MRGRPVALGNAYDVEQDVKADAAAGGFGLDQVELVTGVVSQHDPVPQALRVVGLGLAAGSSDDQLRRTDR